MTGAERIRRVAGIGSGAGLLLLTIAGTIIMPRLDTMSPDQVWAAVAFLMSAAVSMLVLVGWIVWARRRERER